MSELTSPDKAERPPIAGAARGCSNQPACATRVRTCIGCRRACAPEELVRFVATSEGRVAFDFACRAWGRGAWVHPRTDCLARSPRGLARALKRPITQSTLELHQALIVAAWRHVDRLFASAKRAGHLTIGTESVERACRETPHAMLLVAEARSTAAQTPCLTQMLSRGRVLVIPSMTAMGEWLSTLDCASAALTDLQMTKAIARTIAIAQIPAPARASRGSDTGTEVG